MTSFSQHPELNQLLDEAIALAQERAETSFDRLAAPFSESLVLFGAGGLGRKTLAGLRRIGLEPLALADNNPALWGSMVDGLPVLAPGEAARRFGRSAVFVVTIWGAGSPHRLAHTRQQLQALACDRVVSFAHLYWKYPATFLPYYGLDLPHYVLQQASQVAQAYALWADDDSRTEYLAQLRWRLHLDFDGLPPPVPAQYFPGDLFALSPQEVLVDCGAFDGDTVKEFVRQRGAAFNRVLALEPDPANLRQLRRYTASLERAIGRKITVLPQAAGARRELVRFAATGSASSTVASNGALQVECLPLDELLADCRPTFIKMDIEGAEPDALSGAAGIIEAAQPVLAISVYHRQSHLWQIPLFISRLSKQYRLFLRPHNQEGWDLVCYAVPQNRLIH